MIPLYMAALLLVGVGVVHSVIGERYILRRLERLEKLPRLIFGGRELMTQLLRFTWHISTVAWFGIAGILILMAHDALSNKNAGVVIAGTFMVSAVASAVPARARHYSWMTFLTVPSRAQYYSWMAFLAVAAIALYQALV